MRSAAWTNEDIYVLNLGYAEGRSVSDIAAQLERSRSAIRNQAYKLGVTTRDDSWSDADLEKLRAAYAASPKKGEHFLRDLSSELGRSRSGIAAKARKLGLTNIARKGDAKPIVSRAKFTDSERAEFRTEFMRQRHASSGHPMAGRKHTPEALEKIGKRASATWAAKTPEEQSDWTLARMKSRVANFGSIAPQRPFASWKAGWREIGGTRKYYRSRWEANYARYLEWLKSRGLILDWAHEPETFWFEAIKRGVRSYLPDFRVWEVDGATRLYEVKGWMDARSKTTLKRMAKYHPHETIIVVREKEYKAVARIVRGLIPDWEYSDRGDRL